jgi:hypothetical protein
VETDRDTAVSETVDVIRRSSNAFSIELHHPVRLRLDEIATVLGVAEDKRVFIVSHGSQTALLDASIERAPYLQYRHTGILRDFYVFAHACSAGVHLGREVAANAYLYLGFDAPVSAPPASESTCFNDILGVYVKLASFIQNIEYQGPDATGQEVRHFLDVLKEEVLAIERRYDTDEGTRLDAEELICVRQFRDDICAWIGGLGTMLKSKGARRSPYLF